MFKDSIKVSVHSKFRVMLPETFYQHSLDSRCVYKQASCFFSFRYISEPYTQHRYKNNQKYTLYQL